MENEVTAEEFFAGYASRSNKTTEELTEQGLVAIPCRNCDYEACEGWQVTHKDCEEIMRLVLGNDYNG